MCFRIIGTANKTEQRKFETQTNREFCTVSVRPVVSLVHDDSHGHRTFTPLRPTASGRCTRRAGSSPHRSGLPGGAAHGGHRYLAEDVTQSVFTALAWKAPSLLQHRSLVGWLYTATRFAANEALRTERRRRRLCSALFSRRDR